jgi:hypothetical protein
MFDPSKFTLLDSIESSSALRMMGTNATCMEAVAQKIVFYLYNNLINNETGEKACVLVRMFKTHPFIDLPSELQDSARAICGDKPFNPDMKCLVLLASAGQRLDWNTRHNSVGHKAIPLPSASFVDSFPMIRQLIQQMGLEINTVLSPDPAVIMDMSKTTYNVFVVSDAVGSKYIPAQNDFVIPFGVRSALGFGGVIPSGSLFSTIMFLKVPVTREAAELFKTLALSVKVSLLPFDGKKIFA